jgi:hypothetical protein
MTKFLFVWFHWLRLYVSLHNYLREYLQYNVHVATNNEPWCRDWHILVCWIFSTWEAHFKVPGRGDKVDYGWYRVVDFIPQVRYNEFGHCMFSSDKLLWAAPFLRRGLPSITDILGRFLNRYHSLKWTKNHITEQMKILLFTLEGKKSPRKENYGKS